MTNLNSDADTPPRPVAHVTAPKINKKPIASSSTSPAPSTHNNKPTKTIDSYLLSDSAIVSNTLLFGLNFKHTTVSKGGLINRFKKKTQAMDIDVSCLMLDRYLEIADTIWFKNLRDKDAAVRHHGDSLDGNDMNDEAQLNPDIDVETIEVRLAHLPLHIKHLAFIVSAYGDYPLQKLERGNLHLSDDEGNTAYQLDLTTLNSDIQALCVATLSREMQDWRLTFNHLVLNNKDMEQASKQIQREISRFYAPEL